MKKIKNRGNKRKKEKQNIKMIIFFVGSILQIIYYIKNIFF